MSKYVLRRYDWSPSGLGFLFRLASPTIRSTSGAEDFVPSSAANALEEALRMAG